MLVYLFDDADDENDRSCKIWFCRIAFDYTTDD